MCMWGGGEAPTDRLFFTEFLNVWVMCCFYTFAHRVLCAAAQLKNNSKFKHRAPFEPSELNP